MDSCLLCAWTATVAGAAFAVGIGAGLWRAAFYYPDHKPAKGTPT